MLFPHLANWTLSSYFCCHYPHFLRKCCEGFSIVFLLWWRRLRVGENSDKKSGHERFFSTLPRLIWPHHPPTSPMRLSIREIGNYWFRVLDFFSVSVIAKWIILASVKLSKKNPSRIVAKIFIFDFLFRNATELWTQESRIADFYHFRSIFDDFFSPYHQVWTKKNYLPFFCEIKFR